jgi:[FeFe] hydrogenase H-cluster maturation GTPase HydF
MELLPLGPVVIIDTPGLDDEGTLGEKRIQKTKQILGQTDIAVLVVDAAVGMSDLDRQLEAQFKERKIPYLIVSNKVDMIAGREDGKLYASAVTGEGIEAIKAKLGEFAAQKKNQKVIVSDLIEAGDVVVLVTPIDESAPKGRLILPQQMTIRDILDAHGIVITVQPSELADALQKVTPKMVITDSQAFGRVSRDVPREVPLTSFSILMARYKGDLAEAVRGAAKLDDLQDGDTVLISEGCTHHRQCEDIGTVKMPNWIRKHTGKEIRFEFTSGGEFPEDLSKYALVVHCGGCMLNEREMKSRIRHSIGSDVPITNYGIAIAHMHGILARSIEPFPDIVMK